MTKQQRQRRDYNRAYQREMRSRERLGAVIVSRDSRGELQERPAAQTKWTADYIRAYKRDWTRTDRARKAAVKALFDHACMSYFSALPGFLMGLRCGIDIAKKARHGRKAGA